MIAQALISAFEQFLDDPAGVLPEDAINPAPQEFDESDLADPALGYLSDDALPDPERGCIIGIIDDAIPFAHERLRLCNGASRVAATWIQDARFQPGGTGGDLPSGIELRGADIDVWLARARAGEIPGEDAIYRLSGVLDMARQTTPSTAYAAGHGAAVAMLAAGFSPDDPAGRNHPVIAVNLPPKVTEDSMGTLSPVSILASILFIITRARRLCRFIERRRELPAGSVRLPVVINLSFGLTAGARDGSSLLEQFMDAVSVQGAGDLGPIRFVLPTGNHRLARLHGRLKPGEDLGWRLPPDDRTVTGLEVWGPVRDGLPEDKLQITLTPPGLAGATTAFTAPWQFSLMKDPQGREIARAYYTPRYLGGGSWREGVTIIVMPTCPEHLSEPFAPAGEWRIAIAAHSPDAEYQLGVQRDEVIRGFHREARQSWLFDPQYRLYDEAGRLVETDAQNGGTPNVLRRGTMNAYAGGQYSLRAGAVDQKKMHLAPYCSLLHDEEGGDCLAVVDRAITQPGMLTSGRGSGSFGLMSGTSMAAPQFSRWLAQQLAAGESVADRDAIRSLAESQSDMPAPTPVLPHSPEFPNF
ncbi:hypothetical protein [Paracoccus seriniphilus]|uniref:Subtilase family protein n=1 Tax=Paracoccus seriniphilus TaxID=184748 RepID=A0A239PXR6_9RHOB|nr:hypothetical protein [Paracoccus seriniphilus]WCR14070.1 hypothetical protein JHW44_00870 [Paracoccus seriniphilus]SNT74970.1 hypothetical protein SAMN05444959_10951 [Paracoccus seriniphilus]